MKELRIGLCFDLAEKHKPQPGQPADHHAEYDSQETIEGLQGALSALGHQVLPIGDGSELLQFLHAGNHVDLIFNIAEGVQGRSREAQVPALLEMLGVPYTGADPLTLALCLDKAMFKRVLLAEGIPTPRFFLCQGLEDLHRLSEQLTANPCPFPVFVKPAAEGSGKGIQTDCRADFPEAALAIVQRVGTTYGWPVLVEEYLPGAELTVGIVGNGDAQCLGTMEIEFLSGSGGIYSYQTKQRYEDLVQYHVPPRLPVDLIRQAEETALQTYQVCGCRDFGRVDLRLDARGKPFVLEINPLAGLNPHSSDLVILSKARGFPYQTLIAMILSAALQRLPQAES